jgi:hypothetical protein
LKCTVWLSKIEVPKAFLCLQYSAVDMIRFSRGCTAVRICTQHMQSHINISHRLLKHFQFSKN